MIAGGADNKLLLEDDWVPSWALVDLTTAHRSTCIDTFSGPAYGFLSLAYPCEVRLSDSEDVISHRKGIGSAEEQPAVLVFPSALHALLAVKFPNERNKLTTGTALMSRKLENVSPLWRNIRAKALYALMLDKFQRSTELTSKLLSTGG